MQARQLIVELNSSPKSGINFTKLLNQLRELGCAIALDDFGAGNYSMFHLSDLPLDYIKIDRAFVGNLSVDCKEKTARVMHVGAAIYELAKTLGLTVITKGVENATQLKIVKDLHADFIQGYIYSKPLQASSIADFIKRLDK